MMTIERARPGDRPAIEALLAANDLPLDGLELALPTAVVARDGARLAGCAAFEPYGSAGLLRSVCVTADQRGTGLGRMLVAAAEDAAIDAGIRELFLLTDTAADWFPRLGYERTTRDACPADMAASPEFVAACPASAAVLRKLLKPRLSAGSSGLSRHRSRTHMMGS
jgi:amino-acid N-acetyltransferase